MEIAGPVLPNYQQQVYTMPKPRKLTPDEWLRGNVYRLDIEDCEICHHYYHAYVDVIAEAIKNNSKLNLIYGNLRRHVDKRHTIDPNQGEIWLETAQDHLEARVNTMRKELHEVYVKEIGRFMTDREFCLLVTGKIKNLRYQPFIQSEFVGWEGD